MVLPVEDKDFLFSVLNDDEVETEDVVETPWEDVPGLVIEVYHFDSSRSYQQVKIVVGDQIGWTYSDYVWVVR